MLGHRQEIFQVLKQVLKSRRPYLQDRKQVSTQNRRTALSNTVEYAMKIFS